MSGLMSGRVWQSALPRRLKPVAAALADEADDYGRSIFPSVEYIAWKLSQSERSVQENMAELRKLRVIRAVCHAECAAEDEAGSPLPPGSVHGTGAPVHYEMPPEALPSRAPWSEERAARRAARNGRSEMGADSAPMDPEKGAERDTEGCISPPERVNQAAPDPIRNPDRNPEITSSSPALRVIRRDELRDEPEPSRDPGPNARAVAVTVARLDAEAAVALALRKLREQVAVEDRAPDSVDRAIAAWSEHLTLEDVERIRREATDARDGDRGGDWNWIRAVCARVAGARRDRRDPWARGGQADVAGRDHARAPRPRALATPGAGRARTTFAGDGARGGFSTEPPPA